MAQIYYWLGLKNEGVAQLVEHLTSVVRLVVRARLAQPDLGAEPRWRAINQVVESSTLSILTIYGQVA